jgi:hypothetical protein
MSGDGSAAKSTPSLSPVFRAWLDSAEPPTLAVLDAAVSRGRSSWRASRAPIAAGEIGIWIRSAE